MSENNNVVEHNKSFEEGFGNGYSDGRESGLEYGYIAGLEHAITVLQKHLHEARNNLAS